MSFPLNAVRGLALSTCLLVSYGWSGVASAAPEFQPFYLSARPTSDLVKGRDGNLYGTNSGGQLYRFTPQGEYSVVFQFEELTEVFSTGIPNTTGTAPSGRLAVGEDGSIYGLTGYGGAFGYGTLYNIQPDGTFTVLYNFTTEGGTSYAPWYGISPSGLIMTPDGDLFGYSNEGGSRPDGDYRQGLIFKFSKTGVFEILFAPPKSVRHEVDGRDYWTPAGPCHLVWRPGDVLFGGAWGGPDFYSGVWSDVRGMLFKLEPGQDVEYLFEAFPEDVGELRQLIDSPYGLYGITQSSKWISGAFPARFFQSSDSGEINYLAARNEWVWNFMYASDGSFYANWGNAVVQLSKDGAMETIYQYPVEYADKSRTSLTEGDDGKLYGAIQTATGAASSESSAAKASAQAAAEPTGGAFFRFPIPGKGPRNIAPMARKDVVLVQNLLPAGSGSYESVIDVLANDTDKDSSTLVITEVTVPAHGVSTLDSQTKRIRYSTTAPTGDEFTYTITDGSGNTATARVLIKSSPKGSYEGPVAAADTSARPGSIKLTIAENGKANGTLKIAGGSFSIRGKFPAEGPLAIKIKKGRKSSAQISISRLLTDGAPSIFVKVVSESGIYEGTCSVKPSRR